MKAIEYRHSYSSDKTSEQEMEEKFGELLHGVYGDEPYQVEDALLYKQGNRYNVLQADGCSCWDGDWYGYSYTKPELLRWAKASSKGQDYDYRRQSYELLADWVVENIK